MKTNNKRIPYVSRVIVALLLVISMLIGVISTMEHPMERAYAASVPQVINNYPTSIDMSKAVVSTKIALDQMNWTKKNYHSFYDNTKGISPPVGAKAQAYTAATSKTYNGYSTPDHLVLAKDRLRFLGYGAYNNLDLLYTDAYSSFETLDFTFKPKQIKFHTLNQSGFLFNGSFGGANNAYYTGYALLMDVTPAQGKTKSTASLKLVYMDNQLFNTTGNNTFPAAGLTFTTQDVIIPNIVEGTTPDFHVQLAKTATGFSLYIDGKLAREVDPAKNAGLPGFGFFAGYYTHSCKVLTVVEYSDLAIVVKVAPATTSPLVKFIDKDSGAEIAAAQTTPANATTSYVNDEFRVDTTEVQTITSDDGTDYTYVGASISNLNHITYKSGGAANNTVILYYKDPALVPEKHASVDGGATWNADGTEGDPVKVSKDAPVNTGDPNNIINYRVDVKVPSENASAAQPIRFVGAVDNNPALATTTMRPLSALVPSNKYYSYQTATTGSPAKPYDEASFSTLNLTASTVGTGFNPINLICHDPTNHLSCVGHQYAPYIATANSTNASYLPPELAVFPTTGNASPYITSWFSNRINENGLAAGTSRAFENYLWLQAPNLPAGEYKVSVKASLDFRMLDSDDTRITPRHDEKHIKQTYTFTGAAMSQAEYDAFMTAHSPTNYNPTTNPSPYISVTGDFGYMGAGRYAPEFTSNINTDYLMRYQDLTGTISNAPFSLSWNTNNLATGGTSAHTATTATTYNTSSDRNNVLQMMANGSTYSYRGNADASADTTYQTLNNTVKIPSNGQSSVVGLNFTADMTLNTYSDSDDWSDRIVTAIRVYEVMYTPVQKAYSVSDLLPAGLTYVPGSMSTSLTPDYPDFASVMTSANTQQVNDDGSTQDLLTWDFPALPEGVTSVYFQAQVTAGSGVFENYALVTNKSSPIQTPDQTNSTWHRANVAKVTEKFQNFLNPGETLQGDTYTWLPEGDGYGVAPALLAPIDAGGKTYRYYAYSPDGGQTIITDSPPPDGQPLPDPAGDDSGAPQPADYLWDHVYGLDSNVILYFVPDVQVTITSVDYNSPDSGTVLKTWLDYNVPGYTPYAMSPTQLYSIDQYNYVNRYVLDGGAPENGAPDNPAFTADEMLTDHGITLYFAADPKITLKFLEDGNEYHVLSNPLSDIVPFGDDYDPAQSANQPLPEQITDAFTGVVYEFTGYRLDDGANVSTQDINMLAIISPVEDNHTYTLFYAAVPVPAQKAAYVNGSIDAQNGEDGSPADVKIGDSIRYAITLGNSQSGKLQKAPNPSFQPAGGAAKPQPLNFVNGSFETPATPSNIQTSGVPGWTNTAENLIEIQHVGTNVAFAPIAPDGVQYAELNANTAGTLYQTVPTIPGSKVYWEFYHGARGVNAAPTVNTDVMDFLLGPTTANLTAQVRATDSWVRGQPYVWGHYYGTYTVPAGQTNTVFAFRSISASGGTTQGNYLDGIRLYTSSFVELTKSNDAPGGKAGVGDTVTYTIQAQNNGESDAKNVQIFDTLPVGTELAPGSVAIDGTPTSNYTWNASTRELSVNVGAGATSGAGGLIKGVGSFSADCNNAYQITFQVLIIGDTIASNMLYENQGKVIFSDRPDTSATPAVFTNYSNVTSFGLNPPGITITDIVPAGLDIDTGSISNGGTYDPDTRTVTWVLPGDAPVGAAVEFAATVGTAGEFDNTADVTYGNGATEETNTTYHRCVITDYILHLRQVVVDYDRSMTIPDTGYFNLLNGSAKFSVTTNSDQYSMETPFRNFNLPAGTSAVYDIKDILPQYYDYAGFNATASYSPGAHLYPADPDPAQADFTDGNELWVTVYIKPGSNPGKYDWGSKTNDFGTINPAP